MSDGRRARYDGEEGDVERNWCERLVVGERRAEGRGVGLAEKSSGNRAGSEREGAGIDKDILRKQKRISTSSFVTD